MLETYEGNPSSAHHQLARVGGSHAHHEIQVHGAVRLETLERTLQRILRDCGDVYVIEQPLEIRALGAQRGRDYLFRVRRRRVQHVVVPIALQHGLVAVEILVIGRGGVGRGGDRQELRHEIDEHEAAGPNLGTSPAGDKRAPARGRGATERARLDNLRRDCSRDGAQVWSRIFRLISVRNRRSAGVRLSMPRAEILSSTRSISAWVGLRSGGRRGLMPASLPRAARPAAGWTRTLGSAARRRCRSARATRRSAALRYRNPAANPPRCARWATLSLVGTRASTSEIPTANVTSHFAAIGSGNGNT